MIINRRIKSVIERIYFLVNLSTITPAKGPNKITGKVRITITTVACSADPVWVKTMTITVMVNSSKANVDDRFTKHRRQNDKLNNRLGLIFVTGVFW